MSKSAFSILFGGDVCPQDRVEKLLLSDDYKTSFAGLKNVTAQYDFTIINLECPVVNNEYSPIEKCGPNLKCSNHIVSALNYTGVDCVALANNHIRDYGDAAIEETIFHLEKHGIKHFGAGGNITKAREVYYHQINGNVVAFVNFCENEFSIATSNNAGAAPMDAVNNYEDIVQARRNADIVVLIVHGGHEFYQLPSPRMKKLYRWYIDLGADVVINHHQHCYSGYEYYKGKPIFYGLGNLCFDKVGKRNDSWNKGILVGISFSDTITHKIIPFTQCNDKPEIAILTGDNKTAELGEIEKLNCIINNDNELEQRHNVFCESRFGDLRMYLSPYRNKYLRLLCHKGFISDFVTKKKKRYLSNFVMCESQKDIFEKFLIEEK